MKILLLLIVFYSSIFAIKFYVSFWNHFDYVDIYSFSAKSIFDISVVVKKINTNQSNICFLIFTRTTDPIIVDKNYFIMKL